MVGKNIKMRQPSPGCRRYLRIYSRKTRTMYPSSSTSSKKGGRPLHSGAPDDPSSRSDTLPKLSDVPCYTCRRRHVKCDRILPHCAKCAKKGVACLGYRKPLRWADGVAVRGKLKGKAEPVIDSQALSASQGVIEKQHNAIRTELAQQGLESVSNSCSDASAGAGFLELIRYWNTIMCAEHVTANRHPNSFNKLTAITPQVARELPRVFLNGILSTAAVHMLVRNRDNRSIARLVLEMKSQLFEGINKAFKEPQHQRADVLFACITVMFAMEIIEHGTNEWSTHFNGAIKLLNLSGGVERFTSFYPHLKPLLAGTSHFHVMLTVVSPDCFERLDLLSRHELETVCFDAGTRRKCFSSSPWRLLRAIQDTARCARNIIQAHDRLSAADVYTREWILSDVLRFQPSEGTTDIKETFYSDRIMRIEESHIWDLIFSTWRGATTIVVLRYLYFGLPDHEIPSNISRSTTPTPNIEVTTGTGKHDNMDNFFLRSGMRTTPYQPEEYQTSYFDTEHLPAEPYMSDRLSQTPSPIPSSRPSNESITFDHWHRRYEIHNDALSELSNSFMALTMLEDASFLRYAMVPLMVLALVSRPRSDERALFTGLLERFKQTMASEKAKQTPIGGIPLDVDIPWARLDAYSAEAEQRRHDSHTFVDGVLHNSAPEWNWYHMLKRINLTTIWPTTSGALHMELGTEFWAFDVLATCCTEECYTAYTQPLRPTTQEPST